MTKIPNGNWEDDKEICYQALQDGYDASKILEIVYKYGYVIGRKKGLDEAVNILDRSIHD